MGQITDTLVQCPDGQKEGGYGVIHQSPVNIIIYGLIRIDCRSIVGMILEFEQLHLNLNILLLLFTKFYSLTFNRKLTDVHILSYVLIMSRCS